MNGALPEAEAARHGEPGSLQTGHSAQPRLRAGSGGGGMWAGEGQGRRAWIDQYEFMIIYLRETETKVTTPFLVLPFEKA